MCDVLMLAFWVWAVVFWVEGMERDDFWRLPAAGLLIALAALTKYFGACLIPLLAVYGWMKGGALGRDRRWMGGTPLPAARGEGNHGSTESRPTGLDGSQGLDGARLAGGVSVKRFGRWGGVC